MVVKCFDINILLLVMHRMTYRSTCFVRKSDGSCVNVTWSEAMNATQSAYLKHMFDFAIIPIQETTV